MLLRDRQKTFVERSVTALLERGNTLSVAPTGAGKTVMFSEIIGRLVSQNIKKVLVLAHRDELTEQNQDQFKRMFPSVTTSTFDAKIKSWDGQVAYAMVPTLSRQENLATMPKLDLLVIDEAHHAVADTYQRIIHRAIKQNPNCQILGVTATPNRSDNRGLREAFSNVGDQISVGELVNSGHLVPPRTYIMDVGVKDRLLGVKRSGQDFDMLEVEQIMNQRPVNEAVVEVWKEKAGDRQTVVFCSTVAHAVSVVKEFEKAGVSVELITGELGDRDREDALKRYGSGQSNVVVNVAVLTEGWDNQPTSCVVLLRPSSAKSTMVQMIGRGLRTVDAEKFPGIRKSDCVVLDFGTSSLIHGTLEQDVELDALLKEDVFLTMECPDCNAEIPLSSYECPICGHEFKKSNDLEKDKKELLTNIEMMEINLLERSNFEWVDLFGDNASLISTGFNAWGGLFFFDGEWHAVGAKANDDPNILTRGSRIVCLASANDWLNTYESEETAHKTRTWLKEMPSQKQIQTLPKECRLDFNITRYTASARITFEMNKVVIKDLVCSKD